MEFTWSGSRAQFVDSSAFTLPGGLWFGKRANIQLGSGDRMRRFCGLFRGHEASEGNHLSERPTGLGVLHTRDVIRDQHDRAIPIPLSLSRVPQQAF